MSRGLSLTGYHAGDPCGSPTTKAPSSVGTQPSIEKSGSVTTVGVPLYPTTVVKDVPFRIPVLGVTTSSCPSREKVAVRPSTSRREIANPRKSRSNLDRSWVAVALIVAVPESWFDDGS